MVQLGIHAVIAILVYLLCIGLSFQAMKGVKIEKIVRPNHLFSAQIILLFSAIALGFLVGNFLVTLMDDSLQLSNLF